MIAHSEERKEKKENPIHTHIKSDPISTPGYWRLFTTWIMMRYGARVGVAMVHDRDKINNDPKREAQEDFKAIRDTLSQGKPLSLELHKDLTEQYKILPGEVTEAREAYDVLRKINDPKAGAIVKTSGTKPTLEEIVSHNDKRFTQYTSAQKTVDRFEDTLKQNTKAVRDKKLDDRKSHYEDVAGRVVTGLTLAGTLIYAKRVASDIKSVFAEAVAYEHGDEKKSGDVSWSELIHSDNKLVQTSLKNYVKYNALRLASDAVFLMRDIAKIKIGGYSLSNVGGLNFAKSNAIDLAMSVKGLQLSKDILTKQTTFFEDTVRLIDTKLNPIRGLGEQVSTSDVADLYQKYALDHKKDAAFKRVDYTDMGEKISWRRSEPIFNRIASLMNHTYHYKNLPGDKESDNFALPKLIYLLGHDMIDISKPRETLALVEIANAHGMDAVKETASAFKRGASVEECLEKFPVDGKAMETLDANLALPAPSNVKKIIAQGGGAKQSMVDRLQAGMGDPAPAGRGA